MSYMKSKEKIIMALEIRYRAPGNKQGTLTVEAHTPVRLLCDLFGKELSLDPTTVVVLSGYPPRPLDTTKTLQELDIKSGTPVIIQVGAGGVTKEGRGMPIVSDGSDIAMKLLGNDKILTHDKKNFKAADLRSSVDYFAIYFSAHWCPPCKAFTPLLVQTYKTLKVSGKRFEIIFATLDREEKQWDEYWASMPWAALPYGDRRNQSLAEALEVKGIPTLVIFDNVGRVVQSEGRQAVITDPSGAKFPWK